MRYWIAAALVAAMSSAAAQVYRWTDSTGKTQFTDTLPPASAKDVQKTRRGAGSVGGDESESAAEPYALQVARKNHPVKLYSGRDCPGCDEARALLNARGVPFSEVSASTPSGFAELKALTGNALVPTLLVGSFKHRGFDETAYHQSLDAAGYPKTGMLPRRNQAAPSPNGPEKPISEETVSARGPYAPRFR